MGFWRMPYHCSRIIGHFSVQMMVGYILSRSTTVTIGVSCEILRSSDANRKVHGRWHGTSPCDHERTVASRTDALRAYEGKSSELIPRGRGHSSRYNSIEQGKLC